jgi:hypothetical protein
MKGTTIITAAMKIIASFLFLLLSAYTQHAFRTTLLPDLLCQFRESPKLVDQISQKCHTHSSWISASTRWLASIPDETNETTIQKKIGVCRLIRICWIFIVLVFLDGSSWSSGP